MPVVEVKWHAGRTQEQKQQVAEAIGKAMEDIGTPPGVTHVVFLDIPKDDWKVPGRDK
jgi:4-oxalocrotonate tautomerase family enzyme